MNSENTGSLIRRLRTEKNMTQKQLSELVGVSDKAVSKWERGIGCPDVSLLSPLSDALGVDISGIINGDVSQNPPVSGNMKKTVFFFCPRCGNIVMSTGSASVSCCGAPLSPLHAVKADDAHTLSIEPVEDEYFFTVGHDMIKTHYISFIAYVTGDRLFFTKLYPEQNAQARFKMSGHGLVLYHCVQHGLFYRLV